MELPDRIEPYIHSVRATAKQPSMRRIQILGILILLTMTSVGETRAQLADSLYIGDWTLEYPAPWKRWQYENHNSLFLRGNPDSILQRISLLPKSGNDLFYEILFSKTAPLQFAMIHVGNDGWGVEGEYWLDQHLRVYAVPNESLYELPLIRQRVGEAWNNGPGRFDSTADWGTPEALLDTVDIGDYRFERLVIVGVGDFGGWQRPLFYELYSLRERHLRWLFIFVGCPSCEGDIRHEYFIPSTAVLATLRSQQ